MIMQDLIKWAFSIKEESREKKTKYNPKYLPKIEAYVDMIIARGMHITEQTVKMQRYTEEIEDALKKLVSYGVSVPTEPKPVKINENPLKP